MNRIALFLPLALFAVLTVVLLLGLDKDPAELPSALVGEPFPIFSLPSLHDANQMLAEQDILGDVVLVNVWATWCFACRIEHAMLNQLAEQGVKVIGLNYKDNREAAIDWLRKRGDPYAFSIFDERGGLGIDLGVYGAPETYLLDATGTIRHRRVGVVDDRVWNSEFRDLYAQLVSNKR
ncbi:MAG: DsbE family thiol:disulfide interchange protein [Proteobacteria bacterium]|uniref:Thiol:disulfide interchange protein n=1 Tax=SAR92 bacterium BACL26 MAG-121220-bin70 TaxID=1655626 RepID=A0A0R2U8H6_9GAMM|nr:MAG: thiol:disulfide interchange protein [SAR92 bacterium BACL26 MAG-121220-bin70]MDA0794966.1 DsbE family thiol:disulfide interchange protein [Pseudomonadota bacterium]MDA1350875.1 DsbE family thiol:disulfide interchange protein [Pseudomonadota bacterium]